MKKSYLFLAATAILAFASCADNTYLGDQEGATGAGGAISFNMNTPAMTRAESDHETSAANLGNQFIVWGEKSTSSADTKAKPADGHIVFPNYQVNYTTGTAYNTTSNTKDWEYVGYTHSENYQNNITYKDVATTPTPTVVKGSTAAQTIKYWDYSAGSYTFTAVSASKLDGSSKTDIENGYVTIQKNTNDDTSPYNKGYKVTVTANADLTKLYFSDRTIITQSAGTDRNATNAYGGNVTLKFRNALSQIRAGIYETIPGYAISDIKFYVNTTGASPTQTQLAQVGDTPVDAFGAICPNIKGSGYAGDLTVTYSQATETLNQPVVSASGTVNTNLILGTNISTVSTSSTLGESATNPTWDTSGGAFTTVLLQGAHTTNLKLKCNYTLYNSVSGETINVEGATAEVPYQYLQWKPNYKYTYLFKISNNTNGSSGQGVVGLYPITFDAIEITNSDGVAEYITTVSEPSITTFAAIYNTTESKYTAYQTGKNEYQAQTTPNQLDIFATIMDGSTNITPVLGTNVNVYKSISSSDATNFPVTEASLAEAIAESGASEKITYTLDNSIAAVKSGADAANGIPGEDGNTITGVPAIKLANLAAGTYAVEYINGKAYTPAADTDVSGGTWFTDVQCKTAATGTANGTTTYYKRENKTYKVIKVQ